MSEMLLLATCKELPDGEPGGEVLVPALAKAGIAAAWVIWDDPDVDWLAAPLVAVRSVWDYQYRSDEFLAWAHGLGARLLNGGGVFEWNAEKRYLVDLTCPVVPTRLVDSAADVEAARAVWGAVVLKPRIGSGGVGMSVVGVGDPTPYVEVPMLAQPVVESIRTEGETSVFAFAAEDGWAFGDHAVRKVPASGELRAHDTRGAAYEIVPIDAELTTAVHTALNDATRLSGCAIDYARVDLLRLDSRYVVGEIELIEPSLYLEYLSANADRFVELVRRRLDARSP